MLFSKEEFLQAAAPFYEGQEPYLYNLNYATRMLHWGLEIIDHDFPHFGEAERETYICAASYAKALNLNGDEGSDHVNIQRAAQALKKSQLNFSHITGFDAFVLILSTYKPYDSITGMQTKYDGSVSPDSYVWDLVNVIRDADTLAMLGIEDETEQFDALTGYARELLKKMTPEELLNNYKKLTKDLFDGTIFFTWFGKNWAEMNLEKSRVRRLAALPRAIEVATQ